MRHFNFNRPLGPSELILNGDHSIYHLNLLPEDIAETVITVGDPERVAQVSRYFDSIDVQKGKREFRTHTGMLNGKRLTVISTGIGTDNVDIVLNELDALVNVDFTTRTIKETIQRLDIIRIGTSGAIQPEIPIGSFLLSEYAIGLDGLLHYYKSKSVLKHDISETFVQHMVWPKEKSIPYAVECDRELADKLTSNRIRFFITCTNSGFYAPQGREIRLKSNSGNLISKLGVFRFGKKKIGNLEMETSGIFGLSKLMGHRAVSLSCVLANRITGEFSKNPQKEMDLLVQYTLQKLTES